MNFNTEKIKSVLFNLPGWHTKQKIIVFESDDWGSIRIPSKQVYKNLISQGLNISKSPYSKDSLESNDDLTLLLETLYSFKNKEGKNPVFTLNNIVANPDFEKISKSEFMEYHYEYFINAYRRYPAHDRSFDLIREGYEKNVFKPQLHGREHLNVNRWLKSLQSGNSEILGYFKLKMTGVPNSVTDDKRSDFQRAFDYNEPADSQNSCKIICDACEIFKNIWGYNSFSFIAPNFFWDENLEECLFSNGIKILQGQRAQFITRMDGTYNAKYHYTGQMNKLGQIYLIRNCYFEPSFNPEKDWVDSCLGEISLAFKLKKPAIISTHRVNYIGSIDESNRTRNIKMLKQLLKNIVTIWPDVEFMSSDQLGQLILNSKTYQNNEKAG